MMIRGRLARHPGGRRRAGGSWEAGGVGRRPVMQLDGGASAGTGKQGWEQRYERVRQIGRLIGSVFLKQSQTT
jgi:hypothetical protein